MPSDEHATTERRFFRQPVRSEDPSLSPEANLMLTHELQAIVGAPEVTVPEGTLERRIARHGDHAPITAVIANNRPIILVTFVTALVVGAIIALTTNQFWALLLALGVHVCCTMAVIFGIVQLATETEHVSPEVYARLELEGVIDPDRMLSELIEDFSGTTTARGAVEVFTGGHNQQTRSDPAGRAVEQRTVLTPSSVPARPAGSGSVVERLPLVAFSCILLLTVVFAAISGGWMWLLPAIVVPIGVAWILLDRLIAGPEEEHAAEQGRSVVPRRRRRPVGRRQRRR